MSKDLKVVVYIVKQFLELAKAKSVNLLTYIVRSHFFVELGWITIPNTIDIHSENMFKPGQNNIL